MVRKSIVVGLICIFIGSLAGCATNGTYDPARSAGAGALGGAATGAAVGSIVGAATGHAGTGAWVGAAAGGVAGRGGRLPLRRAPQQPGAFKPGRRPGL